MEAQYLDNLDLSKEYHSCLEIETVSTDRTSNLVHYVIVFDDVEVYEQHKDVCNQLDVVVRLEILAHWRERLLDPNVEAIGITDEGKSDPKSPTLCKVILIVCLILLPDIVGQEDHD